MKALTKNGKTLAAFALFALVFSLAAWHQLEFALLTEFLYEQVMQAVQSLGWA